MYNLFFLSINTTQTRSQCGLTVITDALDVVIFTSPLEQLHHYLTPPSHSGYSPARSSTTWVWWLREFLLRPHSLAVPVILWGDWYPLYRHQFPPRTPRRWTSP